MIDRPPGASTWTFVDSVAMQPRGIGLAGFAVDTPRKADRSPGAGLEINGWVIGRNEPVRGVRIVSNGLASGIARLDVPRPDVARDYPDIPHAAASGFSCWAPLEGVGDAWHMTLEAILADGSLANLGDLRGGVRVELHTPEVGHRLVTGPDFAIIGTQRGGTTSLHAYLSAHPRIQTPATKELHFLTDRHARGSDWYLGQFPAEMPLGAITGEATPYALFHPASPRRLRAIAPEAKVIVLLRNPVDRTYSHYLLEKSRGIEELPFEMAIDAEPARLAGEEARLLADPAYVSVAHNHASFLSRGDYAPQLERWFNTLPRDRVLILRSEDLYDSTEDTFARVLTFLGLPPVIGSPFVAHNRTFGPPMDPATRERLVQHFTSRNARLANLLGWDPGWA